MSTGNRVAENLMYTIVTHDFYMNSVYTFEYEFVQRACIEIVIMNHQFVSINLFPISASYSNKFYLPIMNFLV